MSTSHFSSTAVRILSVLSLIVLYVFICLLSTVNSPKGKKICLQWEEQQKEPSMQEFWKNAAKQKGKISVSEQGNDSYLCNFFFCLSLLSQKCVWHWQNSWRHHTSKMALFSVILTQIMSHIQTFSTPSWYKSPSNQLLVRVNKKKSLTLFWRSDSCFRAWWSFSRLFSSAPLPRCPASPILLLFVGWAQDSRVGVLWVYVFHGVRGGWRGGCWTPGFPHSWSGAHYPAWSLLGHPARHSARHHREDVRWMVRVWEKAVKSQSAWEIWWEKEREKRGAQI